MTSLALRMAAVAGAISITVTGCGGGGGGGGSAGGTSPSSPTPHLGSPPIITGPVSTGPAASFETPEYYANYALSSVNASSAYAAGAKGQGVTVGVIDTGIDSSSPELAGAISSASADIVARASPSLKGAGEHGTMVASVIAARKNDSYAHGIAYESTILAVRADADNSCNPSCGFYDYDIANATNYAVTHGAHILNYSLGGNGAMSAPYLTALTNAVANNRILVMAAGNGGAANPMNPAAFAATAAADGQAIAVGSVDWNNQISSFSNRAGSAKNYFLVAPGQSLTASGFGGTPYTVSGTSFSAPLVSGAAAVLLSHAPSLTAQQVVSLLLTTATDLGAPGVDDVYGHGLLNLALALQPQGAQTIPTGTTVAQGGVPLQTTSLRLGAAFGDAMSRQTALSHAVMLDGYGRAYNVDLSQAVATSHGTPGLAGLVAPKEEIVTGGIGRTSLTLGYVPAEPDPIAAPPGTEKTAFTRFALNSQIDADTSAAASKGYGLANHFSLSGMGQEDAGAFLSRDAFASPFLGLTGDGIAMALDHNLGDGFSVQAGMGGGDNRNAAVSQITHRWKSGASAHLQFGSLTEHGSILDSSGEGGFALGQEVRTFFTGLSGSAPLGKNTELFGTYSMGWTSVPDAAGLVHDFSGIRSESFGVGVAQGDVFDEGDRLAFGLSRPLKVVSGTAMLDVPVGRGIDGQILRETERIGLGPSGNEVDAEVSYRLHLEQGQSLSLNAMARFQPDHVAGADTDYLVGARYKMSF